MAKLTVENVYTRHKAKELTKQYFWKLLGMMALAFGIPFGLTLITAGFVPTSSVTIYSIVMIILMIASHILGCGLMLGLLRALITLCRNDETITVGSVFQHMSLSLKGFGLSLWVGLKTLLWALPGYAAVIIVAYIMTHYVSQQGSVSEGTVAALTLLPVLAIIVVFAMVVPAAMRYMLSTFILADKPNTGVFECVRQSKAMMKGHKWQAFKLVIPVFLVMYVIFIVAAVAIGAASAFLATTTLMANILSVLMFVVMVGITLYYSVRMYLCYCIFYNNRVNESTPAEPADE